MIKMKLARVGRKGKGIYRIVITPERSKRTGEAIEEIGTYNPTVNPPVVDINKTRFEYWIKSGAQMTEGIRNILKEEPKK